MLGSSVPYPRACEGCSQLSGLKGGCPQASEEQGRSAQPSYVFNTWFEWAPAVTWVIDISTDPRGSRITDPDMTISRDLGPDVTRP